ncbi:MAG: RDD family protein [Dactylosporangium sp.]|nr:RDD family protein [Dactylosporangium sp.]NNJ62994.1 RDD family protein [Dactylosporangium sp.]
MVPGWYKDPVDPTIQRYWDGEIWIGEAIPAEAVPPASPPVVDPDPAPTDPLPAVEVSPGSKAPDAPPGPVSAPRPHGFVLAPVSARFVARLIDILVVLGLNILVNGWFVAQYVREIMPIVDEIQRRIVEGESATGVDVPSRVGWFQVAILGIATALWFAYEVPSIADTGQTLGKRLMHIKVVRIESQEPLGIRRSWRRWNPLGLPSLLWGCYGFGLFLQAADLIVGLLDRPLHQALHDRSAGTLVVQVGTAPSGSESPDQTP